MVTVYKIENCARCGGNHEEVEFFKIRIPIAQENGKPFTHYSFCPETHEPILMFYTEIEHGC